MARKDDRKSDQTPPGDDQVSMGREAYRGFDLSRWMVTVAGVAFYRVEARQLGVGTTPVKFRPVWFVQEPAAKASMEKLVREAKYRVGLLLRDGLGGPASQVPEDYLTRPADSLRMRSDSGKPAVCDDHWTQAWLLASTGRCSLIILGAKVVQRFVAKMNETGMPVTQAKLRDPYAMNLLYDSYSPLCCWLGQAEFDRLLRESDPVAILEKTNIG